jgi:hypothetical protein
VSVQSSRFCTATRSCFERFTIKLRAINKSRKKERKKERTREDLEPTRQQTS